MDGIVIHSGARRKADSRNAALVRRLVAMACLMAAGSTVGIAQASLLSVDPGEARANVSGDQLVLENKVLALRWFRSGNALARSELLVRSSQKKIPLSQDIFTLVLADGKVIRSSAMKVKDAPRIEAATVDREAARGIHAPGQQIVIGFEDAEQRLSVTWRATLRDGSNYVRQELSFHAVDHDAPISEITLLDFKEHDARVVGTVKGSPLVVGNAFFGFEHPLAICAVQNEQAKCSIGRELPVKAGQTVTYSSVIGVTEDGQLRRGFLNYIERERARPFSPFLTYNSWYDIGFNNPYNEAAALDVINSFGKELVQKRAVRLDSFLFDDGWDDPRTLWSFGAGFSNGFTPLRVAAEKYGAEPGVWLSPWGGYDQAKEERLKYGRQNGLESNKGGFALSGPKYYARFRDVTLKFVHEFGVNQFKIDGTGNVNSVLPGSEFDSDFQAAITLMSAWRTERPGIFINLTTGTYPSPFWLQFADSIWRGDDDHSFAGVGSWRERWITFRDGATYHGIVQQGPLFPLNSLMLHGMIYARHAEHLDTDPDNDFANEVHAYFGSGTQLQEMYITHSLLSEHDWNVLAEGAKWSRNNAEALVDTHWVGGDPVKLEVYGWAAWSPAKGILTLRNPGDKPQKIAIDVGEAFELPVKSAKQFQARSPWAGDQDSAAISLSAGEKHTFTLRPFEVLNLEALPEKLH